MCFHQLGLYSFFGCRRTLNVHQRQDTRLIHNEVGWFAFLQGKKKNAPVLCVFCGSLMNYWSFFYLVSAQLFFRIQKCCFLSEHSWIVFFLFSSFFSFIFHTHCPVLPPTLLWPSVVYPCVLCTHPCWLLSLFIPYSLSAAATSYPLQWCSLRLAIFFFIPCSGFFLNLHSHLSTSLNPLSLAASPLKSFHSPFTSIPSLPLLCL